MLTLPSTRSSIRPPSTTSWPSSTSTFDSMARLLVIRPAASVASCTLETSWKICMRTVPPSATCGRTRSVVPTSLRSMVWKGLIAPAPPVEVNEPVIKGTFWPMMIRASSLSSVTRLGVARIFAPASVSRARARKPRLIGPMVAVPLADVPPSRGAARTMPTFRPRPSEPMFAAASMILEPPPRGGRLVPPITWFEPLVGCDRNCHCTPSSSARSALISTISDSI